MTAASTPAQQAAPILVFYDGHCSVCRASAAHFTKLDNSRGIIECVDFRTDPAAPQRAGTTAQSLEATLHARVPGGALLRGPEAIRAVYAALGRGRRAGWTSLPVIRPVVDAAYRLFAKNRLRWFGDSGACSSCDSGSCGVDREE